MPDLQGLNRDLILVRSRLRKFQRILKFWFGIWNGQQEPGFSFEEVSERGKRSCRLIQVLNLRKHQVSEVSLADRKKWDIQEIDLMISHA